MHFEELQRISGSVPVGYNCNSNFIVTIVFSSAFFVKQGPAGYDLRHQTPTVFLPLPYAVFRSSLVLDDLQREIDDLTVKLQLERDNHATSKTEVGRFCLGFLC